MRQGRPTFDDLVEIKDEEKEKKDIFYVVAPSQPICNGRKQGEHHGEVEFVPCTL